MARKQQKPPQKGRKKPAAAPKAKPKVRPKKKAAPAARGRKVDRRVALFVQEYLIDLNGRQAAIRAGYEPDRARHTASELLAKPEVAAMVDAGIAKKAEAQGMDGQLVVQRLHAIATADPRELVEVHRGACRYCWGKDHGFQRTPRELRNLRKDWEAALAKAEADAEAPQPEPWDEEGGTGFNPYRDPHPKCPECFGEGAARAVLNDTRDLSPSARLLFAGAKQTQHGIEIRMHDQIAALRDVGKHFGVFRDRVELTGKDGGPVQHKHEVIGELLQEIDGTDTDIG